MVVPAGGAYAISAVPPAGDPWPGVEIRHFAALEALAAERSFGRAAARLGYTQPAVSQQLAALERAVGARLVTRRRGAELQLTPAGEQLLRHARAIRARLALAHAELLALGAGSRGVVRVGIYQSVIARFLPALLDAFRRDHPDIELVITDSPGDRELRAALARNELDAAFVDLPLAPDLAVATTEIVEDEYVAVVASDAPFFEGRDEVPAEELAGVPLLAFKESRSTDVLIGSLRAVGAEPNLVVRSDDNLVLQSFAQAGYGVALLPRLAIVGTAEMRTLAIAGAATKRTVGLAWRVDDEAPAATLTFVEAAKRFRQKFR